MKLPGHTDDHVIEVTEFDSKLRIEVLAFWDFKPIWRLKMVASHDVIYVVDSSGPHPDLSKVSGPYTSVGVFGLILGEVRGVDVIVNVSVSLIPFLVIVLLVMMVGRVNSKMLANP